YTSTQERFLFEQLLLERHRPDLAIFVDGLNDFLFLDTTALAGAIKPLVEETRRPPSASDRALALARTLPLSRAAQALWNRLAPSRARRVLTPFVALARSVWPDVVARWLADKRVITAVGREFGVRSLFVWQPVPYYKYDQRYHSFARGVPAMVDRMVYGYELLEQMKDDLSLQRDFLWLADMQVDRKENLYVD